MVRDMRGLVVEVDVVMSYSMTYRCVCEEAIYRVIYLKSERWGEQSALVFVRVETAPKVASPLANGE